MNRDERRAWDRLIYSRQQRSFDRMFRWAFFVALILSIVTTIAAIWLLFSGAVWLWTLIAVI